VISAGGFERSIIKSRLPDLAIGALIAVVVIRGGFDILREAREARRKG
jgi:hypothetical protein